MNFFTLDSEKTRAAKKTGFFAPDGTPDSIVSFANEKLSEPGHTRITISRLWFKRHCGKRCWWVTAWRYAYGDSYFVCDQCGAADGPFHCSPTDGILE